MTRPLLDWLALAQRLNTRALVSVLAVAVIGIGCAAQQAPVVDVGGQPENIASLVGVWRGEYTSAVTGRSGIIRFQLEPDGVTAEGNVAMMTSANAGSGSEPAGGPKTSLLRIHLVQVDDTGTVAGALEPYRDPECGCLLSTSFVGHLFGDRITGRFVSNGGPGHPPTFGRWQADRH